MRLEYTARKLIPDPVVLDSIVKNPVSWRNRVFVLGIYIYLGVLILEVHD